MYLPRKLDSRLLRGESFASEPRMRQAGIGTATTGRGFVKLDRERGATL
ncbi:MAG: hypothetical protein ACR2GY_14125 [Phycisphaerales bacterium]